MAYSMNHVQGGRNHIAELKDKAGHLHAVADAFVPPAINKLAHTYIPCLNKLQRSYCNPQTGDCRCNPESKSLSYPDNPQYQPQPYSGNPQYHYPAYPQYPYPGNPQYQPQPYPINSQYQYPSNPQYPYPDNTQYQPHLYPGSPQYQPQPSTPCAVDPTFNPTISPGIHPYPISQNTKDNKGNQANNAGIQTSANPNIK
jgi:hypothetical protein